MNLAFNLLYACNSRCATCNIHERRVRALSVDEFDRIFQSLGRAPVWVTLTGGEPFLRNEVVEIGLALYRRCRPAVVTIPTNGTLPERVTAAVRTLTAEAPRARWVVNLSLDEVGERHDAIRATPGNWGLAMETYRGLRELRAANLTVGIHTCISRFNAERFPEIQKRLLGLGPHSFIAEMAEYRGELRNARGSVEPAAAAYLRAVAALIEEARRRPAAGIARVVQALRFEYYAATRRFLERSGQMLPCMAGWMSAHVGADGEVWTCSTRAEPLGRLREVDYDFGRLWRSERARALRRSIRRGDCSCPMAGAAYTSLLADAGSLARVARGYLRIARARAREQRRMEQAA